MRLNKEYMGTIALSPETDVTAGEFSTWTITFTAGEYGIDDGGTMVIAWKSVSDWDSPQFDEPDMPGYTTVSTTGQCRVTARYAKFVRSFGNSILIDVNGGYIKKGDQIKVVLGDTSQGSLGMRAQSFCEREHEFRVFLDPCGTARYEEMPERLKVKIVPSCHHEIQAIVPGAVAVGEPFDIAIRALDEFGNPTGRYSGTIDLAVPGMRTEGIPSQVEFPEGTEGVIRIPGCRILEEGFWNLTIGFRCVTDMFRIPSFVMYASLFRTALFPSIIRSMPARSMLSSFLPMYPPDSESRYLLMSSTDTKLFSRLSLMMTSSPVQVSAPRFTALAPKAAMRQRTTSAMEHTARVYRINGLMSGLCCYMCEMRFSSNSVIGPVNLSMSPAPNVTSTSTGSFSRYSISSSFLTIVF